MEQEKLFESIRSRGYGEPKALLHTFTILHEGWELDNEGWIVEMSNGAKEAYTTNHGGVYPMERDAMIEKLEETEESAAGIRKAMELLDEGSETR